jgi:hypothetical protein
VNPARTTIAAALAAAAVLTGCGRDHTDADRTQLRRDMQAVAAAAAAHNYAAATSALNALNADAAAAHASGTLDDSQLTAIRSALAKVQADLTAATTRPPTTTAATPTTSPTKAPPDKHKGGHGHDGGGLHEFGTGAREDPAGVMVLAGVRVVGVVVVRAVDLVAVYVAAVHRAVLVRADRPDRDGVTRRGPAQQHRMAGDFHPAQHPADLVTRCGAFPGHRRSASCPRTRSTTPPRGGTGPDADHLKDGEGQGRPRPAATHLPAHRPTTRAQPQRGPGRGPEAIRLDRHRRT